ncbi:hypothetical protein [Jatrophihabitans sp.]|uniref:hypothetical protein n=1 Tax=Jatrophihabitans sp. TaxID=1932789 RepID=UPI0030C740F4|nr:hypothetical protein [Jatrophihabitans sp.]
MSAAVLRQAAALMRSRVESVKVQCGLNSDVDLSQAVWFGQTDDYQDVDEMYDATHAHISTFGHPVVALALADWLDHAADRWSAITEWNSIYAVADQTWLEREPADMPDLIKALAVAHAYLGTPP